MFFFEKLLNIFLTVAVTVTPQEDGSKMPEIRLLGQKTHNTKF